MVVSWLDLRFQGILSPISSQALTLPLIGGRHYGPENVLDVIDC